jgi:hypothetical protein
LGFFNFFLRTYSIFFFQNVQSYGLGHIILQLDTTLLNTRHKNLQPLNLLDM